MLTDILNSFSVTAVIALIALIISAYTAYQNFLTQFKGRVWFSDRIILLCLNEIPSICLVCSIENSGANAGALDDIRVQLKTTGNQSSSTFYPILTKEDYSIYENYTANDWRQFSTISLPAKHRTETYIFFKPLNDNYSAVAGEMQIDLQVRWYGKDNWQNVAKKVSFTLTQEVVNSWNNPANAPIQIASDNFMQYRRI